MDDELLQRCVKCPSCGDVFTVKRGMGLAEGAQHCAESTIDLDRRDAGRANTVSIRILHEDTLREFPVKDISLTSIGIYHLGWLFEIGRVINFDLIEGYKFLMKGIKAKVVRVDDEAIGCVFDNVSHEDIAPIYQAALSREDIGTDEEADAQE